MKTKRIVCIFLVFILLVSSFPLCSFAVDNDISKYTPISDAYEFAAMAENPKGKYFLTGDIVFDSSDFKRGGDFYNSGNFYETMSSFSGVFDGCGHTIYGLKGDCAVAVNNNGTIKNLRIAKSVLSKGAICKNNRGTIVNCKISSVESEGLVKNNERLLKYCFSENSNCGICYENSDTIENCINKSDIATYGEAAGIACANSGDISNCGNYGNITSFDYEAAGICLLDSDVEGSVENCYNYGTIEADEEAAGIAVGCYVYDSINYGDVTGGTAAGILNADCIVDSNLIPDGCVNTGKIMTSSNDDSHPIVCNNQSYHRTLRCYYLKGTGDCADKNATVVTSAKLSDKNSFPELDFSDAYQMASSGPKLKIENESYIGLMMFSLPNKPSYIEGDSFNKTGIAVKRYSNLGNWTDVSNYEVSGYTGNMGYNTITVKSGSLSAKFSVLVQRKLSKCEIELASKTMTATGKALKMDVDVYDPEQGYLDLSKDYKLTYSNNVNPGKATVKITGTGTYTGSVTKTFIITPMQVKGLKSKTVTSNSVTLTWKKQTGVSGYSVEKYNAKTKKWSACKKDAANTVKIPKLTAGAQQKFRVRSYKKVGDKTYYGKYSSTLSVYTLTAAPAISSLKSATANKAVVTWKKVSGAKKYIVYKSTNNKKWTKVGATTKLTYTLKDLTGGKKIYVKLVAVNGDGKNSTASKVKSVTVKKKAVMVAKPTITGIYAEASQEFTVYWKKVKEADGYQFQYSIDSRNISSAQKLKVTKKDAEIWGYSMWFYDYSFYADRVYVRMRAYKTVNGKTYYSGWTNIYYVDTYINSNDGWGM